MPMKQTTPTIWIRRGQLWHKAVLGMGLLVLATSFGCLGRSPVAEHFVLGMGAVPGAQSPATGVEAGLSDLAIVIGPVRLPGYLDRPQLARLEAGGAVELDEFSRWLGGFEDNFLRAISLDVARRTDSIRVTTYPSKAPFPADVRVKLHVDDLIAEGRSSLRVRIRWAIVRAGSDEAPELFLMEESVPLAGKSNLELVAAYDAVLSELGARITAALPR